VTVSRVDRTVARTAVRCGSHAPPPGGEPVPSDVDSARIGQRGADRAFVKDAGRDEAAEP
jgi:hypothetical protein